MRESSYFFIFISVSLLLLAGIYFDSRTEVSRLAKERRHIQEIVKSLKLTDMSFSTDARYTRHPSQADLFSAFQDYPGSIEHFPTGSVIAPPDFSILGTTVGIRKR